jgi:hypothetical protein
VLLTNDFWKGIVASYNDDTRRKRMDRYSVVHAFAYHDQWMPGFSYPDDDHAYPVNRLNFSYINRMNINIRHIMTLFISEFDLRAFSLSVFVSALSICIPSIFIATKDTKLSKANNIGKWKHHQASHDCAACIKISIVIENCSCTIITIALLI